MLSLKFSVLDWTSSNADVTLPRLFALRLVSFLRASSLSSMMEISFVFWQSTTENPTTMEVRITAKRASVPRASWLRLSRPFWISFRWWLWVSCVSCKIVFGVNCDRNSHFGWIFPYLPLVQFLTHPCLVLRYRQGWTHSLKMLKVLDVIFQSGMGSSWVVHLVQNSCSSLVVHLVQNSCSPLLPQRQHFPCCALLAISTRVHD